MKLIEMKLFEYQTHFKHPVITPKVKLDYRKSLFVSLKMSNGKAYYGECNAFETNWYDDETISDVISQVKYWYKTYQGQIFDSMQTVQASLEGLEGYPATRSMLVMAFYQMFYKLEQFNVPYGATVSGLTDSNLLQLRETEPQRVKLKWSDNILNDVQKIQALPFNLQIAIDANESLTDNERDKLQILSEADILYLEEPFATLDQLMAYDTNTILTVAIDEKATSKANIIDALHRYNVEVIIVKPFRLGGIDRVIELIDVIKQYGGKVVIGGMYEYGLSRYFTAMVAQWADFPSDITPAGYYFEQDVVANSGILKGGSIQFEPPTVLTSRLKRIY
ncbi:o-succinylbenzoate synthase [Staphylococcus gallinarum]|uniref:o-succinylbenzoate synthase n=1 Tax=Staphylococcus gallinarum TaxID=1293 RepID=UPI0030C19D68